jgi:isoleucyl-tRNA synthetase
MHGKPRFRTHVELPQNPQKVLSLHLSLKNGKAMSKVYKEYKQLNLPEINKEILEFWKANDTFQKSISTREGKKEYTFYEGPPSANGMPGIHHVMARAIKDIFCRFKTLQGYKVQRKAGWDTHGLPIELQVEKELGITKEDIGTKISVDEYNQACRKSVMKFTDKWNALTEQMGYWVDMSDPYITYENDYIESVWWLLGEFYKKDLLYKGYTIQPYSPAAGTGLSSHELNQPGTYKPVKDTTIVAQFKALGNQKTKNGRELPIDTYFLAWTTTPWTLPSNTALAVGKNIDYVLIKTFNPYTGDAVNVILAKDLMAKYFSADNENLEPFEYNAGDKKLPYIILDTFKGTDIEGVKYEQLLPYAKPDGDAFRVIIGDFVSTEDGTGIVHIAPSHGADDFRTAKQNGIGAILLVDKQGRFTQEVTDMPGEYVKEEYLSDKPADYKSVDVRIAIKLKETNRAFKVEKYEHTYPHCWRTDKPILYYPLDSWFIKTTSIKQKLIDLNKTINWKPESTGTGRFGNWLENLVDWNLSRSRYWGVPLPIWRTEDGQEEICINSIELLRTEIEKSIKAGFMSSNPYAEGKDFDVHRPYVDDVILVSANGNKMFREKDLIDVWFDSGAMPYAQQHYPFENKEMIDGKKAFPADFIAEGVDQTRGWFFTLHVIAAAIFDTVAYKTVVSNGLVLDKVGQKMSKRLGNAVDPFMAMDTYGADALRWYMITNAEPWDNLKFDMDGVVEVQRKFFGTLYNTYSFFTLYANLDGFVYDEKNITPVKDRTEFDQWIISELQSLIKEVTEQYEDYNPTKASRPIQDFVTDRLSNWYVRLSRRRFWKGEMTNDKKSAYETLYECMVTITQLMSPVAPFFAEWLYKNLTDSVRETAKNNQTPFAAESVHLTYLNAADESLINKELEHSMSLAQRITSLILSLRKKHKLRVRQPLQKVMIPVLDPAYKKAIEKVQGLIQSEVNVKEISFLENDDAGMLVKRIKPDFKKLGPKYGKLMKEISAAVGNFGQQEIATIEREGSYELQINNEQVILTREDVEIASDDIPGWLVANDNELTVALDITLTPELIQEGLARDIVNRVQNVRKDRDYQLTDRIQVKIQIAEGVEEAVKNNLSYICSEVLADKLEVMAKLDQASAVEIELEDNLKTLIEVSLV